MNTIKPKKYPVDVTGRHPDNLVANERHFLDLNQTTIIPRQGYFYNDGFIARVGDRTLVHGVDYAFGDLNEELTRQTGKAIFSVVFFKDIRGDVDITYQCYGHSNENNDINTLISEIKRAFEDKSVSWENITNKPSEFTPEAHNHPVSDVTGWDGVIKSLTRIVTLMQSNTFSANRFYAEQVRQLVVDFENRISALSEQANETRATAQALEGMRSSMEAKINEATMKINQLGDEHINVKSLILDNVGTIRLDTSKEKVTINKPVLAPQFHEVSDRRFKHSIKRIQDPLLILQGLKGYTYYLKGTNVFSAGVMAQDLVKVYPVAVNECSDKHRMMTVNYNTLIPVLVEAINQIAKRQQEIIDLTNRTNSRMNAYETNIKRKLRRKKKQSDE